jgi:hypothetical protein
MTKKQVAIGCSLGLLAVAILIYAGALKPAGHETATSDANGAKPSVGGAQAIGSAGMADDRQLVGVSHYVFVGKITRRIGNESVEGTGATQYAVEVLLNTKGKVDGTITLAQLGVSLHEDGRYTALDEQAPLQIGATYVFATRYGVKERLYTISSPN